MDEAEVRRLLEEQLRLWGEENDGRSLTEEDRREIVRVQLQAILGPMFRVVVTPNADGSSYNIRGIPVLDMEFVNRIKRGWV